MFNRRKYQKEEREKEKKVKYYDEVLEEADEEIKTMSFDEFEAKENENWDFEKKEREDFDKMMNYDPELT